jgi:hypothetical protein
VQHLGTPTLRPSEDEPGRQKSKASFLATLLGAVNSGKSRIAIFSVPK